MDFPTMIRDGGSSTEAERLRLRDKIGNVVMLNTGGPWMTVTGVRVEGCGASRAVLFNCHWFDADGTLQSNEFYAATLTGKPRQTGQPKAQP